MFSIMNILFYDYTLVSFLDVGYLSVSLIPDLLFQNLDSNSAHDLFMIFLIHIFKAENDQPESVAV
jgi:hypothetical protein